MKRMEDKSVDVIITDPPYGVNKSDWDTKFPNHWIKEALRISKKMLVMTSNKHLIKSGSEFGNEYKDCIVLHAINGMTRSVIAFGNWIPVLAIGEWKWQARPNYIKFNVKIVEQINHPSPKPIEAMVRLIHYYTDKADLIYDPFMGSGTTAIAANMLKRKWIGSEVNPDYIELSLERLGLSKYQLDSLPNNHELFA